MRLAIALLMLLGTVASAQTTRPVPEGRYVAGYIDNKAIPESSGLIESRKYPGVFWTHNDSGNPPQIFAIDRTGQSIAPGFTLSVNNRDWEDIATDDEGHLYIAETGNNSRTSRQIAVYMIDEPAPRQPARAARLPVKTAYQLRFPNDPFDIESLFIWKKQGYLISKHRDGTPATLYRFSLQSTAQWQVLERVTTLHIRVPCTSADISPDGRKIVVLTVTGPYLFEVDGDPAALGKAIPTQVPFLDPTMEGACFVKEGILATDESRHVFLFPFEAFKP
jgi:hypothetical protein